MLFDCLSQQETGSSTYVNPSFRGQEVVFEEIDIFGVGVEVRADDGRRVAVSSVFVCRNLKKVGRVDGGRGIVMTSRVTIDGADGKRDVFVNDDQTMFDSAVVVGSLECIMQYVEFGNKRGIVMLESHAG